MLRYGRFGSPSGKLEHAKIISGLNATAPLNRRLLKACTPKGARDSGSQPVVWCLAGTRDRLGLWDVQPRLHSRDRLGSAIPFNLRAGKIETRHCARLYNTKKKKKIYTRIDYTKR